MANADRDLAQRVVDALNQYEELRDSSITVSVRQGRVLLEGSVKTRLESDGAGRIANRIAGNGYVSNQLVARQG
jgi:osmotically-inducible protein OsmY